MWVGKGNFVALCKGVNRYKESDLYRTCVKSFTGELSCWLWSILGVDTRGNSTRHDEFKLAGLKNNIEWDKITGSC